MKAVILSITTVLLLGGCASTPVGSDLGQPGVSQVASKSDANVILFRKKQFMGMGAGSRLKINGTEVGYIAPATHVALKMPAGKYKFEVDSKATLGVCELTVDISPDAKTYLEVKRLGGTANLLLGGVIGSKIASDIESDRDNCSGTWQINELEESEASELIAETERGEIEAGSILNL